LNIVKNIWVNFLTDRPTEPGTGEVDTVFSFLIRIEGAAQNNKSTARYRFRPTLLHDVVNVPKRRSTSAQGSIAKMHDIA